MEGQEKTYRCDDSSPACPRAQLCQELLAAGSLQWLVTLRETTYTSTPKDIERSSHYAGSRSQDGLVFPLTCSFAEDCTNVTKSLKQEILKQRLQGPPPR